MILATHALTGAAIGKYISNPEIIILVSLIVHYSMDSLRHGEYFDSRVARVKDTWWKVALDILIALIIIGLAIYFNQFSPTIAFNILLGAFISMFPDFLTVLHWKFKNNKILAKIKAFHGWAHHYTRFPQYAPERQWTLRNALNDILISIAAILILFLT